MGLFLMPESHYLLCLPYLPLLSSLQLGPWLVTSKDRFNGPWLSRDFKELSEQLLDRFDYPYIMRCTPAILVSAANGADGTLPNEAESISIQRALNFSFLAQNPYPSDDNYTWRTVTADNIQLQYWPIRADGFIGYPAGGRIKTLKTNLNLEGSEWRIPHPLELQMPSVELTPDHDVAKAIYDISVQVLTGAKSSEELNQHRQLLTAIDCWSKAWLNTPSIRDAERVVLLKTAFEALLGLEQKDSHMSKELKALREIFNTPVGAMGEHAEGLLWNANQIPRHEAPSKLKKYLGDQLTDFEHWFMEFTDRRNTIIHEGMTPDLDYEVPESAFSGHFVAVADRVLREAILLKLHQLDYPDLWCTPLSRKVRKACRKITENPELAK